ncbi:MAG: hypothetical protein HZA50_18695, partial [Planctomycetes bacterium]|nr:hypothetical protein [Planctomycetota bacterium]
MKHRIAVAWALAAGFMILAASPRGLLAQEKQADKQTTDIPVTRVVLFSSGVGYFEHSGSIDGNATARLMFKADQINDVLKSMVVMSEGSSVTGVNYASQDPILRALRSFGVDMSGSPSLADLLQQLRGAEVIVMA